MNGLQKSSDFAQKNQVLEKDEWKKKSESFSHPVDDFERDALETGQSSKAVIELKSLILAQIERWRHALHMQVERQRGSLLLPASGERVSNISERVLLWGITGRKVS